MENRTYNGGCQCQSVRYEFSGTPLTCYTCHCTNCQTASGSAFGLSMIINDKDINITEGEIAINNVDFNGTNVQQHHCAQCGTALWFSADTYPNIAALKPGTFDDTAWFKPIAHLWVRSAQPWVVFDQSIPQYEKQPEIAELVGLWAQKENT